uniref:Serine/arginine-rich splicing factor 7 n=1 Tax=Serinus canaria TaxID=9135 RepID=A0A8C9KPT0_SERCA
MGISPPILNASNGCSHSRDARTERPRWLYFHRADDHLQHQNGDSAFSGKGSAVPTHSYSYFRPQVPFRSPPLAHACLRAARGRRGSRPGGRRVRRRVRAGGGAVGMSRYGRYGGETKVYVGNLGTGAGKGELERAFSYYGPLRTVWIARNPPGFAFVEFEDPRDAEDAVRGLDGKVICGSRVRVEVSTGMPRRSRYDRPPARRPFDPNDRCYECGEKGHYAYDCHRYSRRRRSRFLRLSQSP